MKPQLTKQQNECMWYLLNEDKTTEVLFGGGAGGGKSFILCAYAITMCLKFEGIRGLIGRSKLDTLKKTTLNTFFDVCGQWGLLSGEHYTFNAQTNIIKFFNGSEIILKDLFLYPSDRNFDSLGSLEITFACVDECNMVVQKGVQVLASRIRYKLDEFNLVPKILMTCNPAKNWVYSDFYRPWKDGNLPEHRKFIQTLVDDNPFVSRHYKDQLNKLDIVSKQRLLFGDWEFDETKDSLIEFSAITHMFEYTEKSSGEMYISCDVARYGADKTVIMLWKDLSVKKIIVMEQSSVVEVAQTVQDLMNEHTVRSSHVIIDSDGVGGGVSDILRGTKSFVNGSKPLMNQNFNNIKSQCFFKLADLINAGEISVNVPDSRIQQLIVDELSVVKRKDMDKDGKMQVIPKEKMKDLIGRSPDFADALMMRMFYEINQNVGRYFVQ
jgi:PBSX family phage terminase large subunit